MRLRLIRGLLVNTWMISSAETPWHTAYMEMRDPGSYYLMLAKAEQITRTGRNPDTCHSRTCRHCSGSGWAVTISAA
ncbi:MAG: hypothetical protein ACRDTD_22495 [Pseudonocardiaceae bacterium]